MTQSFDEWFDTTTYRGYVDENDMESAWDAGAQSKQAEIDELRNKLLLMKGWEKIAHKNGEDKRKLYTEVKELRKRIDDALKAMDAESENSWGLWKEKADMYEQGASNAYEKSYWILKGKTNEQ